MNDPKINIITARASSFANNSNDLGTRVNAPCSKRERGPLSFKKAAFFLSGTLRHSRLNFCALRKPTSNL